MTKGVALVGLGPIGLEVARHLPRHRGLELRAAIDPAPELANRTLDRLLPGAPALPITASLDAARAAGASAAIVCTHSTIAELEAVVTPLLMAGLDVVSSGEELAWPWEESEVAARLDGLARSRNRHLLGTGVNPGFVLDALPAMLLTSTTAVEHVEATRVVDSLGRRAALRRKTGCGLRLADFQRQAEGPAGIGHRGLRASARLLGAALGLDLELSETIEPVIAASAVETPEGLLPAGHVSGVTHRLTGRAAQREVLRLRLTIAAGATPAVDRVRISADPPIELHLVGGISGDAATAARLLSAVLPLQATPPGLRTILDLPLWSGSVLSPRGGPPPAR